MLKPIVVALTILIAIVPHAAFAAGTGGGSDEASEVQQSRALLKEGNHAKAEGLLRKAVADDPASAASKLPTLPSFTASITACRRCTSSCGTAPPADTVWPSWWLGSCREPTVGRPWRLCFALPREEPNSLPSSRGRFLAAGTPRCEGTRRCSAPAA